MPSVGSKRKQLLPTALLIASAVSVFRLSELSFVGPFGGTGRGSNSATARQATEVAVASETEKALLTNPGGGKRLLVLGGAGYVGREVCKLAVSRGYTVTSLSRRGENPEPGTDLDKVNWAKGDATDLETVKGFVQESDAVVHAIGLLFDIDSGLSNLNIIVSGSGSVPGEKSTYDAITRQTAFNVVEAIRSKFRLPFDASPPTPLMFVSAAEAGWPEMPLGDKVESIAPEWLKRYLVAKRAVEKELASSPDKIRAAFFRPSLIWSWTKFDVLPVIPIFNLANALGVPFVDKTVTVGTLSRAIIAGLENASVVGPQRFMNMEELEQQV